MLEAGHYANFKSERICTQVLEYPNLYRICTQLLENPRAQGGISVQKFFLKAKTTLSQTNGTSKKGFNICILSSAFGKKHCSAIVCNEKIQLN